MTSPLPTLQGSEKQVAWASDIRAKSLKDVEHTIESYINALKAPNTYQTADEIGWNAGELDRRIEIIRDVALESFHKIGQEVSAKWWIDHRSLTDQIKIVSKAMGAAMAQQLADLQAYAKSLYASVVVRSGFSEKKQAFVWENSGTEDHQYRLSSSFTAWQRETGIPVVTWKRVPGEHAVEITFARPEHLERFKAEWIA